MAPIVPRLCEHGRRSRLLYGSAASWRSCRLGWTPRAPLQTTRGLELIADKVGSFGGRLEETGPGDVVAVFGLEPADNAPSLAALAALAIQTTAAHGHAEVGDAPVITVAIHYAEHLVSQPAASARIALDGKAATWSALESLLRGVSARHDRRLECGRCRS